MDNVIVDLPLEKLVLDDNLDVVQVAGDVHNVKAISYTIDLFGAHIPDIPVPDSVIDSAKFTNILAKDYLTHLKTTYEFDKDLHKAVFSLIKDNIQVMADYLNTVETDTTVQQEDLNDFKEYLSQKVNEVKVNFFEERKESLPITPVNHVIDYFDSPVPKVIKNLESEFKDTSSTLHMPPQDLYRILNIAVNNVHLYSLPGAKFTGAIDSTDKNMYRISIVNDVKEQKDIDYSTSSKHGLKEAKDLVERAGGTFHSQLYTSEKNPEESMFLVDIKIPIEQLGYDQ